MPVAVAGASEAAQAWMRPALSRHDLPVAQLAIHRCNRHHADDIVLLRLIGVVNDMASLLEGQHGGGGARTVKAGINFGLVDRKVV